VVLADGGAVLVLVGGVLLVGFFGFFAAVLVALGRFVSFVFRMLLGGGRKAGESKRPVRLPAERVCGHPRCGHVNPGGARYCARCGSSLGPLVDIDSYG
jgi:hypothetical protein